MTEVEMRLSADLTLVRMSERYVRDSSHADR